MLSKLYLGNNEIKAAYLDGKLVFDANPLPTDASIVFIDGHRGIWIDPSDVSTLYQDPYGLTPVTASGQTVGLVLDKSQKLVETPVVTYKFETAESIAGWIDATWDAENKALKATSKPDEYYVTATLRDLNTVFEPSTGYKITVEVIQGTGGSYTDILAFNESDATNSYIGGIKWTNGLGKHTMIALTPNTLAEQLQFRVGPGNQDRSVLIKSITVTKLQGNHAKQVNESSRPMYMTDGILHWLRFTSTDTHLKLLRFATPLVQPFSLVCSTQLADVNTTGSYYYDDWFGGPDRFYIQYQNPKAVMSGGVAYTSLGSGARQLWNVVADGPNSYIRNLGAQINTFSVGESIAVTSPTFAGGLEGAEGNLAQDMYGFVIHTNTDLSKVAVLEQYLADKAAIVL